MICKCKKCGKEVRKGGLSYDSIYHICQFCQADYVREVEKVKKMGRKKDK